MKNSRLIQSIVILMMTTLISLWLYNVLNLLNIAMLFIIPILFSALHNTKNEVIVISILSIILFDVLFIPPRFEITVHDANYLISFVIMFIIGQIVSTLVKNANIAKEFEISKKVENALLELLSHELRTPLAVIKGYSSSLLDKNLILSDEEKIYFIENIDEHTEEMDQLINNLINTAKLKNGIFTIEKSMCDIEEIIASALLKTEKKGFAAFEICSDIQIIYANAIFLEQAIINLLDNAFKYGYDVKIITQNISNGILVSVVNKGELPLDDEMQNAIEPFTRLSNSQYKRGLGLGLHVVKLIAEIHGGNLKLKSEDEMFVAELFLPKGSK